MAPRKQENEDFDQHNSSQQLDELILKELRSQNQNLRKDKEILFTKNWELEEQIGDLKHQLITKESKLEQKQNSRKPSNNRSENDQDEAIQHQNQKGTEKIQQLAQQLRLKNERIAQFEIREKQLLQKMKAIQADYELLKQESEEVNEQMKNMQQNSKIQSQNIKEQKQKKEVREVSKSDLYVSQGFNNINSNGVPTVKVSIDVGSSRSSVRVNQKNKPNAQLNSGIDDVGEKSYALMKSQNELFQKTVKNMKQEMKKMEKQLQESFTYRQQLQNENQWLVNKLKDNKISIDDLPTNFDDTKSKGRSRKSSKNVTKLEEIDSIQNKQQSNALQQENKALLLQKQDLIINIKKLQNIIDQLKAENETCKNVNNGDVNSQQIENLMKQNAQLKAKIQVLETQIQNKIISVNSIESTDNRINQQNETIVRQLNKKIKKLKDQNQHLRQECEQVNDVMENMKLEKESIQAQLKAKIAVKQVRNTTKSDNFVSRGYSSVNCYGVPNVYVLSSDRKTPSKIGKAKSLSKYSKDMDAHINSAEIQQKSYNLMKSQNELFQKTIKNLNIQLKKYQKEIKSNYMHRVELQEQVSQLKDHLNKITQGKDDFVYKHKQQQQEQHYIQQPAKQEKAYNSEELKQIVKENNTLRSDKYLLFNKNQQLQNDIAHLQQTIEKLQENRPQDQETNVLKDQKDFLFTRNQQLQTEISYLKETIGKLQENQLKDQETNVSRDQKNFLITRNQQLETEISYLKETIDKLQENHLKDQGNNALRDQKDLLFTRNKQLQKQVSILQQTVQNLQKTLSEQQLEIHQAKQKSLESQKLAINTVQMNQLKQQITALKEDIKLKETEIQIAVKKAQSYQQQASTIVKKLKGKQDQNKCLHDQLDQIRNAYLKLKSENINEDRVIQRIITKPSAVKSVDGVKLYQTEQSPSEIYLKQENMKLIRENKQLTQKYTDLFQLATASQKLLCQYQMQIGERDRQNFKSPPRQFSSHYRSPPKH